MTAKYFVVLDQINGNLYVRPSECVTSENAAAYAKNLKTSQIVLAQADDVDQANRFLRLLKQEAAA